MFNFDVRNRQHFQNWNICLQFSYVYGISEFPILDYDMDMELTPHMPRLPSGKRMKLPLILVSIVAYVVLATIWICSAELVSVY
jgi:hypothetical protein